MASNPAHRKAKIVYFSHGGGPLPILNDTSHQAMIDFMVKLPSLLKKPDAILVISAHWEERAATLLGSASPSMFYDYYGFPAEAYAITYPAPGHPDLAQRIAKMLNVCIGKSYKKPLACKKSNDVWQNVLSKKRLARSKSASSRSNLIA